MTSRSKAAMFASGARLWDIGRSCASVPSYIASAALLVPYDCLEGFDRKARTGGMQGEASKVEGSGGLRLGSWEA